MDIPAGLFETLATLLGGGGAFFSSFKLVKEGEKGIKLRFGRAVLDKEGKPKEYDPGLKIVIPLIDGMYTRHVRVQTIELQGQSITIANGLSYVVDAVVRFRVTNIYNALFVVDDLNVIMNNVSMAILREVLTPTPDAEGMAHTDEMSRKLKEALKKHEEEWGVEIQDFSIISCVPTVESQQIVNVTAGVKVRMAALKDALGDNVFKHTQLAAALVGIPVSTALGHERVRFVAKNHGSDVVGDED